MKFALYTVRPIVPILEACTPQELRCVITVRGIYAQRWTFCLLSHDLSCSLSLKRNCCLNSLLLHPKLYFNFKADLLATRLAGGWTPAAKSPNSFDVQPNVVQRRLVGSLKSRIMQCHINHPVSTIHISYFLSASYIRPFEWLPRMGHFAISLHVSGFLLHPAAILKYCFCASVVVWQIG